MASTMSLLLPCGQPHGRSSRPWFFFSVLLLSVWFGRLPQTIAMFAEDAGQLDFTIQTAGHGPVRWVHRANPGSTDILLTSDASGSADGATATSGVVAARSLETGEFLWRRSATTTAAPATGTHMVAANSMAVVTVDVTTNTVRSFLIATGDMQWEKVLELSTDDAAKVGFQEGESKWVVVQGGQTTCLDPKDGSIVSCGDSVGGIDGTADSVSGNVETNGCRSSSYSMVVDPRANFLALYKQTGEDSWDPVTMVTNYDFSEEDPIVFVEWISCLNLQDGNTETATYVVNTRHQVTSVFTLEREGNQSYRSTLKWKSEEGLGAISSALLLDVSEIPTTSGQLSSDFSVDQDLLTLSSRLALQYESLQNIPLTFTSKKPAQTFGYDKVALLLSQEAHKIYGMYTSTGEGQERGTLKYTLNLPLDANFHRILHGSHNPTKAQDGNLHGKANHRDAVVISQQHPSPDTYKLTWSCFDASTGHMFSVNNEVPLSAPIRQIVPTPASSSVCRQAALVVLQDWTVLKLPPQEGDAPRDAVVPGSKILYGHYFDSTPAGALLETFHISPADTTSGLVANVAGRSQFPGETIVKVAYPSREEVMQSPCSVLGDQSLLLKYLNPHLVVVVTMTSDGKDKDPYRKVLNSLKDAKPKKRKPLGASPSKTNAEEAVVSATHPNPEELEPNLFVNLIDSVSGRVLYRASHANAVSSPRPSVILSENWVFYSFMNDRTRRTEIGVLSLYEGKVDSKGLTAFNTPEQATQFSSLDAREAKPIVLAKTYGIAKAVTALGVTHTRAGISGKKLLAATMDGSIFQIDRKILEPRRPMGQVKEDEKKEGLRQYSELIPMVTYLCLSYSRPIQGVSNLISASTDLESQTLVLAVGGPDLFFTRTSPSRGFDVLPESFNRVLLAIVVVALLAVVGVLQHSVAAKKIRQGWM